MIGAVVTILLIWGPQKLPELAKSLGQAKRELEIAGKVDDESRKQEIA